MADRYFAGHFLVASPFLNDPHFFRSVVLLLRHDEEGAFGVVLNRPLNVTIAEIWKMLDEEASDDLSHPMYYGGPVNGPMLALHTVRSLAEGEAGPGFFFTTDSDHLCDLVRDRLEPFRICSGYSGWASSQLEGELEEGSWLTLPATAADIFSPDDDLWKRLAARIGLEIIAPTGKSAPLAIDPEMN